jgi:hypothetical protein
VGIAPDTKDWTWVLERPCPECGFDTRGVRPDQVATMIRDNASRWEPVLLAPGVAQRPTPAVWSPLEYACHVRDVFLLYDERLRLMLAEDDPLYPNWDQDATAVEARYDTQDPRVVSTEILAAAAALAQRFAGVSGASWQRPGRRGDGARFTVETFARYLIHDPVHHLHDVGHGAEGAS